MEVSSCLPSIGSCSSPKGKSRSLKKQWSSRRHGAAADHAEEPCSREWPVEADQYELLEFAGKGAHAVVFKGRCKLYDETVAIKRLDLDANWDLTALIREATLMKKFNHPGVLPLYAAFVAGRELWFVTPFMGCGSVRSIMKQHFPLGLDEVLIATIMHPVLEALEYVHRTGIHRDVKADNILVSEEGDVVLADFGVAAARMRPVSMVNLDMQAVMATTFVGTPCWMAPEVMKQSEDGYNTSADIWSFGITLIELAHGRPPLARMHPMRVLMDTMHKPAPQLDDPPHGTQFSKAFKDLVDECLHKDPDMRPTASALLGHRFFRMARDPHFLQQHFLAGIKPEQQQQQQQQQQRQEQQLRPAPDSPTKAQRPLAASGSAGVPQAPAGSPGVKQQHDGPGAAAGRADSGFLSGLPVSGPPSRLFSGWLFPPTAAGAAQQLGSLSCMDGAEQLQLGAGAASGTGGAGRLGSAACSAGSGAHGSAAGSLSLGSAERQRSAASGGSAASLEQQLQPFVLQQAVLRAGSGFGPGCGSGPSGSGLRLGSARQFGSAVAPSLLESWGVLAAHPEDAGAEEEEAQEMVVGPPAAAAAAAQGDRSTGTPGAAVAALPAAAVQARSTALVDQAALELPVVRSQAGPEDPITGAAVAAGDLAALPAARGSSHSSCSSQHRSAPSCGSGSSRGSAGGLTQAEVEAMLSPAQQRQPPPHQGTGEALPAAPAGAAVGVAGEPVQAPVQGAAQAAAPKTVCAGDTARPGFPASWEEGTSSTDAVARAGVKASSQQQGAAGSSGSCAADSSHASCLRVPHMQSPETQAEGQGGACCSPGRPQPRPVKQLSFKEAVGSLIHDLKERVLSPRAPGPTRGAL